MADFPLPTYSFMDVYGTINGPGLHLAFGNGTGQANEGITIEMAADKNTMTVGASGEVMHALMGTDAGTVTINVLKTSPLNAALNQAYNYQKQSSATWGQNVITITNPVMGDHVTCSQCAFQRRPTNSYASTPPTVVWALQAGHVYSTIGA